MDITIYEILLIILVLAVSLLLHTVINKVKHPRDSYIRIGSGVLLLLPIWLSGDVDINSFKVILTLVVLSNFSNYFRKLNSNSNQLK